MGGFKLLQDLPNRVPSPLSGDHDTGVEDQSQAGGFQGCRFRMISSTSAAKSESNVGAKPVSSSWAFASAMHSDTVRRYRFGSDSDNSGIPARSPDQPLYIVRVACEDHRFLTNGDYHHDGVNDICSSGLA
jgi:hypothetical protein